MDIKDIPPEILARTNFTFFCRECRAEHKYSLKDILETVIEQAYWSADIRQTKGIDIEYLSGAREVTRRVIIPKEINGYLIDGARTARQFTAFCTLRNATRTFIPGKIIQAFDAETGEKVDAVQWMLERLKA